MTSVEDIIEKWKERLIDLSKRNRLLFFKRTKTSTVKLKEPSIESIYNRLVKEGKGTSFPWRDVEKADSSENTHQIQLLSVKKTPPLGSNEIATDLNDDELEKVLNKLRLKARASLSEQGINTLFVAFGFLKWKEASHSSDENFSPIVLVPVELKREDITRPYILKPIDEETVINPALIHKMKHDFGLNLPTEEDFTDKNLPLPDLKDIFNKFKEAIQGQKDWSILEDDVYLGRFSFAKFIMYKDLEKHTDRIKTHPITAALAGDSSGLSFDTSELPCPEELDSKISPEETFQVLDADSSQQEAIVAAKRGLSFVLQGPPGTGKSQTITNIMSECLAEGKKVLFVSEKMAALEVVHKRLQECRLSEFCLEAHSHKADKKKIIEELGRALQHSYRKEFGSQFDFEVLKCHRERLNQYVRSLHSPCSQLKISPFKVHGKLAKLDDIPDIRFDIENVSEINPEEMREVDELLERLVASSNVINQYDTHPWKGCIVKDLSLRKEEEISKHLSELYNKISQLKKVTDEFAQVCSISAPQNIDKADKLQPLIELLAIIPQPPPVDGWFDLEQLTSVRDEVRSAKEKCDILKNEQNLLFERYTEQILQLDLEEMIERFEKYINYSFMRRLFSKTFKRDKKLIRRASKKRKRPLETLEDLKKASFIKEERKWFSENRSKYEQLCGGYYNGIDTIWDKIESALTWTEKILRYFAPDFLPDSLISTLCTYKNGVSEVSNLLPELKSLLNAVNKELEYLDTLFLWGKGGLYAKQLKTANQIILDKYWKKDDQQENPLKMQDFQSVQDWLKYRLERLNDLEDWINFQNTCLSFEQKSLGSFVDAVLTERPPIEKLMGCFYKRFYRLWIDEIYTQEPALRDFKGDVHNRLIDRFRDLDQAQLKAARDRIRKQIYESSRFDTIFSTDEQNILKREVHKKRRHKPIRKLFTEISNLLLAIKPCLLMSPLSVSQFLNPNLFKFDVVIFDEASQICTEDAIGAIFRGKQLIVVGDNKQLPPTRFFVATDTEEFEEDDREYEPLESILDDCGVILHEKKLLWHYRSRHEHLITFSNRHFYEGRLITFPGNLNEEECGIEFVHVPDGMYDRGGSRQNLIEARKVVELVFQHFDKYGTKRSLGIVAFSEAQEDAIWQEIELRRKKNRNMKHFLMKIVQSPFS